MTTVAREAGVSRPGLYLMFETKEALFREAVSTILSQDLVAVASILGDATVPLGERLVASFDRWAGRWIEQPGRDITEVVRENPDLLDQTAADAPAVFEGYIADALAAQHPDAAERARTLISVSVGLKHQTHRRDEFLVRLGAAVDQLL